jgi:eukaryotic-like serine/threonine-protein kinase
MPASPSYKAKELYEFGPFRVDAERAQVTRGDEVVPLTPKAFQILLLLVRNSNQVVTKDEILRTVWPDTIVEEGNLTRNIFMLRKALGESSQDHKYVVTVPNQGYRLAGTARLVAEVEAEQPPAPAIQPSRQPLRYWKWIVAVAAILLVVLGVFAWKAFTHQPILTAKDTVVLGDFTNSTGDAVFDETLRQGTAVQLGQSPFFSLVSDQRVRQTLRLMGRSPDNKLTPEIAREICERTASSVVLLGSIARLGTQYVIGLRAENCRNGDVLDEEQVQATRKEDVLGALDKTVTRSRTRLGESIGTLQKFDRPLEEATTPSLEALKAYSLGRKVFFEQGNTVALPYLQRAVELDPNFAIAYRAMSGIYRNLNEQGQMLASLSRAYELRDRASERERLYITADYFVVATGEVEKGLPALELWRATYPRDYAAYVYLGVAYEMMGNLEKSLEAYREALRLEPNSAINYAELGFNYLELNRLQETQAVLTQARERGLENEGLLSLRYKVAYLKRDRSDLEAAVVSAMGKPGTEDVLLDDQAEAQASYGHFAEAHKSVRRAVESAVRNHAPETAALYLAKAAMVEAESGNRKQARSDAGAALALAQDSYTLHLAPIGMALSGETASAEKFAEQLDQQFPVSTYVQRYQLPAIRAAVALERHDAEHALDILEVTKPYDLGDRGRLIPIYLRGRAYLALHQGKAAAGEFQKVVDRWGLIREFPWAALAHLQLARAYAMSGETKKAADAYADFLTLWKDADPDIPIFIEAKSEYAALH